jgi:OOP family OmpA-OmpF porin
MRLTIISLFAFCCWFALSGRAVCQDDAEGSKDCPYLTRMPNFFISESNDKEFDSYTFYDGKKIVTVEGKLYQNMYRRKDGAPAASILQIRRNYSNAIKTAGGKVMFDGVADADFQDTRAGSEIVWGKLVRGNNEVWIEVFPYSDGEVYSLTVIEKQAMKQEVTANDMLQALNTDGHIALYINFDVNKATIKPESKPIVDQIVGMLKMDDTLNISIEGHTDNSGKPDNNQVLSKQRAQAVANAISSQGIGKQRLSVVGWGQTKPIADNATEEGKAKNRRVELVKK